MNNVSELKAKTIVISGGTSGIGRELVRLLSAENKVLVIARPSSRLVALEKEFPGIEIFPADLSHPADYEAAADRMIKKHGKIDVLINNAAVQNTPTYLDDDFNYDSIRSEIHLNFTSVCALSYLLLPAMLDEGRQASIMNVNSGLALAPKTNSAIYCATKAGMDIFSQSLSYQLESTNVKVLQAFLPLVDTPMTQGRGKGKLKADDVAQQIIAGIAKGAAVTNVGKVKVLRFLMAVAPVLARKIMKGM